MPKGFQFDADGNETQFDFAHCMGIAKRWVKGTYSIEYEAPSDPYQGVQHIVDELLKYLWPDRELRS